MSTRLRALVVYESMFGNTREVARAVTSGLLSEGVDAEPVNVAHTQPADDADYDLLVVGAPTHAFSLSRASTRQDAVRQGAADDAAATGVREWLEAEARADAGLAAVFDTRVAKVRWIPKTASSRAARLLTSHGYRLLSKPAGFLVDDTPGPLVDGELERAEAWGRQLAQALRERVSA